MMSLREADSFESAFPSMRHYTGNLETDERGHAQDGRQLPESHQALSDSATRPGQGEQERAFMNQRSGRHIAVLFHARSIDLPGSIVYHLAAYWREAGHRVTFLRGTSRYVPADLLFMHVDLSVVPEEYVEFASRYPVAVNIGATDIRKSCYTENRVTEEDGWTGPVIAKSDLNYGGLPEHLLGPLGVLHRSSFGREMMAFLASRTSMLTPLPHWNSYPIFDRIDEVPSRLIDDPRVVIERFLPEIENDLYHVRLYQFLGDRSTCRRIASTEPLVKSGNSATSETIEPHPLVEQWREGLCLDYGKLDYVIHEGIPILFDANKTPGTDNRGRGKVQDDRRRFHAGGIDSLFR